MIKPIELTDMAHKWGAKLTQLPLKDGSTAAFFTIDNLAKNGTKRLNLLNIKDNKIIGGTGFQGDICLFESSLAALFDKVEPEVLETHQNLLNLIG